MKVSIRVMEMLGTLEATINPGEEKQVLVKDRLGEVVKQATVSLNEAGTNLCCVVDGISFTAMSIRKQDIREPRPQVRGKGDFSTSSLRARIYRRE